MSNSSTHLGWSFVVPPTSIGNVIMILFSIFLPVTIIFLNVSVFVCILLNKVLRGENRFMYMLSTCVSDICTGVSYYYVGVRDVKDTFDSPTRTFHIVPTFLGLSFMATLAAQADRYHAVVSPLNYSRRMTRNRTVVIIGAYWFYAFVIVAIANLVTAGVARTITSMGSFISNILAVIIMIGLNVRLFIVAKFQLNREQPSVERDSKRASIYLILVVVAFFLATWLPLLLNSMVCNFVRGLECSPFKNEGTDPFRILPRVNAALTPLLYIRGCSALRDTLFSTLWKPCSRKSPGRLGPVKPSSLMA